MPVTPLMLFPVDEMSHSTSSDSVSVHLRTEGNGREWDTYVRLSPHATFCHASEWASVIKRTYGHDSYALMAQREGVTRGILPLVLIQSRFLGASLTSMPFMDYGGICADDQTTAAALLSHARELQMLHRAGSVELRQRTPLPDLPILREDKVSMILDLASGDQVIWKALPAKVRNQVRKAEKAGLSIITGGVELLPEFYDVFVVNMRDLGSPVHSQAFFANMATAFGVGMQLMLVRDQQKTVGGLIALFFKDTIVVPWASSLREYFPKCPNNLLYWSAIQAGCGRGCKLFDFGRSSVGSGTYDFKRQWGAQPQQLYWQVMSSEGKGGSAISASDSKYRLVSEVWKRLPIPVTRIFGPRIRKYLSN